MRNSLWILLSIMLSANCQNDSNPEAKEWTPNKLFTVKLPLNVEDLKSRFWFSGGITLNKDSLKLADGSSNKKALMGTTKKISHDDMFTLTMNLDIATKVLRTPSKEIDSDDVSFLALQFSRDLYNFTYKPTDNDTLVFDGLVFFLLNKPNSSSGYIVYRYFKKSTSLSRKYIQSLFPISEESSMKDDRYCVIETLQDLDELSFEVDYVKNFSLELKTKTKNGNSGPSCISIPNIMRYLSSDNAYFSIKSSSAKNCAFNINLYKMQLMEKKHSLDIKEELQISQSLVGEIFDKVKHLTEQVQSDKKSLGQIMNALEEVNHYSIFMRLFSKDLNNGTKLLQENMMEFVNRNNYLTLNDFPQLEKIREKIDFIERKQNEIYSRFRQITNMLLNKRMFSKLNKRFRRVDKIMNKLLDTINSDQFVTLNSKTEKLLNFLKNVNFKKLFRKAKRIIKSEENSFYLSAGNYGIVSIIAICLLVLVLSCAIIKKITKAEKEHIL